MQFSGTWHAVLLGCLIALTVAGCAKSPEELLAVAQQQAQTRDVDAAIVNLKNALQKQPDLLSARRLLGEQYLLVGDARAAVKELERAKQLGAPTAEIQPLILRGMLDEGRAREVLDQLERLHADALTGVLWSLRGEALLISADPDSAKASFDTALRMQPTLADAHMGLARIAWSKGDNAGALREFQQALKLDPSSPRVWLSRGDFALSRGDSKGALASYLSALKKGLGADKIRAEIGLVRAYLLSGNFKGRRVATLGRDKR